MASDAHIVGSPLLEMEYHVGVSKWVKMNVDEIAGYR